MTTEEISKQKLDCIRLALQVPGNLKEFQSSSFGGQPQFPHAKSTAEILKDAEAIFEWITKPHSLH